jgi:hypothetical protein
MQVGPPHPSLPPATPRFYFGRELGRGDRSPLAALDLSKRRYLGAAAATRALMSRKRVWLLGQRLSRVVC